MYQKKNTKKIFSHPPGAVGLTLRILGSCWEKTPVLAFACSCWTSVICYYSKFWRQSQIWMQCQKYFLTKNPFAFPSLLPVWLKMKYPAPHICLPLFKFSFARKQDKKHIFMLTENTCASVMFFKAKSKQTTNTTKTEKWKFLLSWERKLRDSVLFCFFCLARPIYWVFDIFQSRPLLLNSLCLVTQILSFLMEHSSQVVLLPSLSSLSYSVIVCDYHCQIFHSWRKRPFHDMMVMISLA